MLLTIRDLIVALTSVLLSVFIDRGLRWRKARLGSEGISTARKALYEAQIILNSAVASGGYLQQPWIVDGLDIQMARLEFDLKWACGAVADGEFTSNVEKLIESLRKVWVENHPAPPLAVFEGQSFPQQYLDWESVASKASTRQISAAREGLLFQEAATHRLVKLSKYS